GFLLNKSIPSNLSPPLRSCRFQNKVGISPRLLMQYFDELAALLDQEQAFDKAQHEALLLQRSVQERIGLGVTWFPIAIAGSELGRGDYLTITVTRNQSAEAGHQFRFGMPVALFSNHNPQHDRLQGTIAFAGRD